MKRLMLRSTRRCSGPPAKSLLSRRILTSGMRRNTRTAQISSSAKDDDLFELMDIPRKFDLDLKTLEANYKKLQQQNHPDNFGTKSEELQLEAAEVSSSINGAYTTLRDPLKRARYMIHGDSVEPEDTIMDPELLMEVMEIQEQLEVLDDQKELRILFKTVEERYNGIVEGISKAFYSGSIAEAESLVSNLSYYSNLKSKIERRLDV
mmetsp:Transcript_12973/g.31791  ORF Transcript_12973/g.31791 Transcript_12973/m.31791 type:complete len:207 (-) Transcript_12973:107-727(-)|eukprot:CAMPEP_0114494840 /NCGR_PEP_ID=MMETSP0109-20121206/4874_1 /TAXON_ID=29199 /ORGANISM="Chlorarachnion reptans, Strain CCCM449" /LENGTH=206 /DNA_ID=CAMNT_0001671919 /DNA_START=49 /DNA_END=669 /DNA_ORIENTATION=-